MRVQFSYDEIRMKFKILIKFHNRLLGKRIIVNVDRWYIPYSIKIQTCLIFDEGG